MENERKLGEVRVEDLTLDIEPKVKLRQLEAIQEYLLAEGRNNENVNSEILKLRDKG